MVFGLFLRSQVREPIRGRGSPLSEEPLRSFFGVSYGSSSAVYTQTPGGPRADPRNPRGPPR
eukprot:9471295-Pyramimonas_sp.AAC.1